jgi:ankyrin repeat protein
MTPLQHAAFKGHVNICSILLEHGADVNDHEHDQGYTALMFGALSGKKNLLIFSYKSMIFLLKEIVKLFVFFLKQVLRLIKQIVSDEQLLS